MRDWEPKYRSGVFWRVIPTMVNHGQGTSEVLKKTEDRNFTPNQGDRRKKRKGKEVTVTAQNSKDEEVSIKGDYVLVSIGRRPYTDGLNTEAAGINVNDKGQVEVDEHLRTNVEHIYAIGDVVKGAMLAHKAEEEGVFVAEQLAGQKPHINYLLIRESSIPGLKWPPWGIPKSSLKRRVKNTKQVNSPLWLQVRARASGDTDGLVKVLADAETDEILGVHMIGPRTADMIAEAVVAMEYRAFR